MRCSGIGESYWLEVAIQGSHTARVSLFIKRHQKINKVGNWHYYLKEKKLSSVKVALSIEWRCNSNVYGTLGNLPSPLT